MNLSTQFQIEQLIRVIDECQDIDVLREHTKNLMKLYFTQRDVAKELLKTHV